MTCIKDKIINRGCGFLVVTALLVAGCGPSQNKITARKHLNQARAEYAKAEMDRNVTTYANDTLVEANNAIKAGDKATDYKEIEQQAYLAERKTQIAKTLTDNSLAGEDEEALSREKDKLLFQTEQQADANALALKGSRAEVAAGDIILTQTENDKKDAEAQTRLAEKKINTKSRQLEESKTVIAAGAVALKQTKNERNKAELEADKANKEKAENELFIKELSRLTVRQTTRGVTVTLGDVLFATSGAKLSRNADGNVKKLVEFMNKYPKVNVLIEGYTDSVGTQNSNVSLSRKRANSVETALVNKGIGTERITTTGYGENYPAAGNDTKIGRQQNRRVEVLLLREGVKPEAMFLSDRGSSQ